MECGEGVGPAASDRPAVDLARAEGITLVVETGNGTMVNSNYTAKLIDALDAKDVENFVGSASTAGVMNWPQTGLKPPKRLFGISISGCSGRHA